MKKLIALAFLIPLFLSACGGYQTGIKLEEKIAYLYFTGNAENAQYSVDNGPFIEIKNIGEKELYPTSTGKHVIIVQKAGKVLVHREFMLGDGMSKEIKVP